MISGSLGKHFFGQQEKGAKVLRTSRRSWCCRAAKKATKEAYNLQVFSLYSFLKFNLKILTYLKVSRSCSGNALMLKLRKTRTGSFQAQGVVFPSKERNKLTALKSFLKLLKLRVTISVQNGWLTLELSKTFICSSTS